jgi:hypothetical protein
MGEEADSAGWGAAVARLVRDGAREIVVVPLMVSSHGSHYRQIRYYAGELDSLPPELAAHDHHSAHAAPGVPMRVTPALDAAPELAEALAGRWSWTSATGAGRCCWWHMVRTAPATRSAGSPTSRR